MVSIIVPVYNEEESLYAFYEELTNSFQEAHEIIFVDDGSRDKSLEILKELASKDKKVKIYSFRKNRGKAEALTLGFQKAKGDYVVTLDADLQDKPSEIINLLQKAKKEDLDVVSGWRKNRRDSIKKIISSRLFNSLASIFWGLNLHDYNCGLKLYSRDAAKSLDLYGGMHRFIPLLAYGQGFAVSELAVEHDERKYGKSKYGFSKIWKDLPDIFTMLFLHKYGKRPMHFFGAIGGAFLAIGVLISIYLTVIHFQGQAIGERPLLFLGVLLIIVGLQIFFTGFLADIIINISHKNNREFSLKYSSEEK